MYFTVSGLPAGLQSSNLNPEGFAGGTLTIQGIPTTAGMYPVKITAQNGVGVTAQQTLMLNVIQLTGPAPASGTTCNGSYNGTFNGNVTLSAGQNCAFYGGGINGNVSVNGGQLSLANARVTGNMAIQGGAGFSIGGGTTITGNLSIQNVASGVTGNQICGAKVNGNVLVSGNATPVQIGSNGLTCSSNSVGDNLTITSNTGAVQVYDNVVQNNLSCSGNSTIAWGGNQAAKKTDQCAAF